MSENAIAKMSADVNVGIDEVVSVFVSQYEDTLFTKKKELSNSIKTAKANLKDLDSRLERSVDKSQFEMTNVTLGIKSKVDNVDVVWESKGYGRKKSENVVRVTVEIKDTDKSSDYRSSMSKNFEINIEKGDVLAHKEFKNELEGLSNELTEVMGLIKSVSRKERQVRGRISSMKLKDAGYEDLLNNEDILKLVKLDD